MKDSRDLPTILDYPKAFRSMRF